MAHDILQLLLFGLDQNIRATSALNPEMGQKVFVRLVAQLRKSTKGIGIQLSFIGRRIGTNHRMGEARWKIAV